MTVDGDGIRSSIHSSVGVLRGVLRGGLDEPHEQGGQRDSEASAPASAPIRIGFGDVLASWEKEGPVVHEPTGWPSFDAQTGGGLVYGTTTVLQGAPDACKTAVLVHVTHVYLARGIVVGLLPVDEEPSDLVTRFAQRIGFDRDALEQRDRGAIEVLRSKLDALPIAFYTSETTIEAAAEHLARFADGRRAMLGVDSLQVVRCAAELAAGRELATHAAIEARTLALRAVATRFRLLVIATSEQSRAAYKSRKPEDQIDPMAAGKGSGSIEYKAKVLITMRKVPRVEDTIDCYPTKNKLQRGEKEHFFLELDRPRQTLRQVEAPAADVDEVSAERSAQREADAEAKAAQQEAKAAKVAEQLLAALVKANARGSKLTSRRDLYALVKGDTALKTRAVSLLVTEGRIDGGHGKPFAPRYSEAQDVDTDSTSEEVRA